MKQHCQQQCNRAKKILSQQEDDEFVILGVAEQESDRHWLTESFLICTCL